MSEGTIEKDYKELNRQRQEFRARIYVRHNGLCFYCNCKTYLHGHVGNKPLPADAATIDHIVCQSETGVYIDDENVVLACHCCNKQRMTMNAETFLRLKHTELNHPIRWFLMRHLLGIYYPGVGLPKATKTRRKWYRKHADRIRNVTGAAVLIAGSVPLMVPVRPVEFIAGFVCLGFGVLGMRVRWFTRKPLYGLVGLKP